MSVFENICRLLDEAGVPYRTVEHGPTRTSEESAAARGEPLSVGAKALVVKTDDVFRLFVVAADKQFDSNAVRKKLGAKKTRFATPEELMELTGLVPGSLPPFGEPILKLELYADVGVGRSHDRVAFNAGSLTNSVIMATADWERLAKPVRFAMAKAVSE
jgi:prolyl-tRNA editing enzyme YbaK/EbsC (Cys-tRNA(Pro) deacylase)